MNGKPGRLGVVLDGVPLGEEEARAFWARFSLHMDEHRGDLRGFAEREGLASVHPTMQGDRPVLVASRVAPQKAYANAPLLKPEGPLAASKNSGERGRDRGRERGDGGRDRTKPASGGSRAPQGPSAGHPMANGAAAPAPPISEKTPKK